jgi:hypothetical protein
VRRIPVGFRPRHLSTVEGCSYMTSFMVPVVTSASEHWTLELLDTKCAGKPVQVTLVGAEDETPEDIREALQAQAD